MHFKLKRSLRFKFIISYLILVILTIALLNTYGHKLMYNKLISDIETNMYAEADNIKTQYLTNAYLVNSSIPSMRKQFSSIQNITEVRIWISNADSRIIVDSDVEKNKEDCIINDFDSLILSKQSVENTNISNLLSDKSLCIIYPVSSGLDISFYIILSTPTAPLHHKAVQYVDAILTCYIIVAILFFIVLLYLYLQTIIPLKSMQNAAKVCSRAL